MFVWEIINVPIRTRSSADIKVHVTHMGPVGPRWAPCWPMNLDLREIIRRPQLRWVTEDSTHVLSVGIDINNGKHGLHSSDPQLCWHVRWWPILYDKPEECQRHSTTDSRYIAVEYSTILHETHQWQIRKRQNFQLKKTHHTHHPPPPRGRCMVCIVQLCWENWQRVIASVLIWALNIPGKQGTVNQKWVIIELMLVASVWYWSCSGP